MKGSQMHHLTANKNLFPKGIMGRMQPYHSFLLLNHTILGISYQALHTWTPQKYTKQKQGTKGKHMLLLKTDHYDIPLIN